LPEPRQIEGIQQVLIKWGELRFTFSFQFSLSFIAIYHNSHDTYMTPCDRSGAKPEGRRSGACIEQDRFGLGGPEEVFV
jgi:hypothetical protein